MFILVREKEIPIENIKKKIQTKKFKRKTFGQGGGG